MTNEAVEHVALSRAWVLDRLMQHAQVCLGEIPLRLKMRKAHTADVIELETHQRDPSAANRALELLGREVNLFTEKKEIGKPGDFDHMSDEELMEFIEAQGEVVRELERELLPPPGAEAAEGCYQAGKAAPSPDLPAAKIETRRIKWVYHSRVDRTLPRPALLRRFTFPARKSGNGRDLEGEPHS